MLTQGKYNLCVYPSLNCPMLIRQLFNGQNMQSSLFLAICTLHTVSLLYHPLMLPTDLITGHYGQAASRIWLLHFHFLFHLPVAINNGQVCYLVIHIPRNLRPSSFLACGCFLNDSEHEHSSQAFHCQQGMSYRWNSIHTPCVCHRVCVNIYIYIYIDIYIDIYIYIDI